MQVRLNIWKFSVFSFLIFTVCGLLFSCSQAKPEEQHLSEEEMIGVLTDIYLLEGAYVQNTGITFDTLHAKTNYQEIFKKHKIDYNIFKKEYDYYQKQPERFLPIYETVIERLNELQIKVSQTLPTDSTRK